MLPHCCDTRKLLFITNKIKYQGIYSGHGDLITNNPKIAYVPNRCTSIFGKDYTNGLATYASPSVVSKTNWQYPQSLVLRIPVSNLRKQHLQWRKIKKKWEIACPFHTEEDNSLIFIDALNWVGDPILKHDSQWLLDSSKEYITFQCTTTKGTVFSP